MNYADTAAVKILTKEIVEAMDDDEAYNSLLTQAVNHADRKINRQLRKNNVPTPTSSEDDLVEAGNLYSATFIFDTYYSDNETRSPSARTWEEDADNSVKDYIDTYLSENMNNEEEIPIYTTTCTHYR